MNFRTLTLRPSPNQYLVAPEGLCENATPHRTAPVFSMSREKLDALMSGLILKQPRTRRRNVETAPGQHEVVQRTALLGFPDWITFEALEVEGGKSTLALYSRSVYGWSDLGANKKRIDGWLAKLEEAVRRQG
mgnify:FL=1|jgi:uncharacterized protein (DUF1499 family)